MKGKMKELHLMIDQHKKTIKIAAALILIIAAVLFYGIKENSASITTVSKSSGVKTSSAQAASADRSSGSGEKGSADGNGKVFVDIGGEVKKPGVYGVSKSARIYEVVDKAGGLTSNAETSTINQAETVTDGQKITIPSKDTQAASGSASSSESAGQSVSAGVSGGASSAAGTGTGAAAGTESGATTGSGTGTDSASSASGGASSSGSASSSSLININTADSATLQQISGVGPVTAEKIIEYRTQNGAFRTTEDIKNVSGIGDKTYEKMKDMITV